MDISTIIEKKRKGGSNGELTKEEIKYFCGKYAREEISEAQAAALMSYIYEKGLTEDEMVYFIEEMACSGDVLDLSLVSQNIVDKHSTGGIGVDKITLILLPIMASFGLPVAKISNPGIAIFGGIIDKLSVIPGFNTNISTQEFLDNVEKIGISIASEKINIAPIENKFYRLRTEIACRDCIPLIAISLMSLKIATGTDKIAFDLTCGKGSYLKTKNEAKKLGKLLVKLGKRLNKKVGYVITSMNEPVGKSLGNILEIQETIKALQGNMSQDIKDTIFGLGSVMMAIGLGQKDLQLNSARIMENINSGKALNKFKQMVVAQGGDEKYINSPDLFPKSKYVLPIYAPKAGYIAEIDADIVNSVIGYLGISRTKNSDVIDNTAGIVFEKKVGDEVKNGEIIGYVHSKYEDKVLKAIETISDAYRVSDIAIISKPRVLEVYGV